MTDSADVIALVDGEPADTVPLSDRGLAYGDGLFETLLLFRGRPVWWGEHLDRLEHGARTLGIAAPPRDAWQQDLARLLLAQPAPLPERRVVKLLLTRGSSRRGYAIDPAAPARRIVQVLPAPPAAGRDGIALRWCALRLARQPRLAGLKHLNRLEQVLARAEGDDPAFGEGLLCDDGGQVVSAIAANLFIVRQGRLLTPPVAAAGVAGVCRRWLLEHGAAECALAVDDVHGADELFICNSVRGILPVCRLDERRWPVGPVTREQSARLAAAEPAFA